MDQREPSPHSDLGAPQCVSTLLCRLASTKSLILQSKIYGLGCMEYIPIRAQ